MEVDELYLGARNIISSSMCPVRSFFKALGSELRARIRGLTMDGAFDSLGNQDGESLHCSLPGLQYLTMINDRGTDMVTQLVAKKSPHWDMWLIGEDTQTERWNVDLVPEESEKNWTLDVGIVMSYMERMVHEESINLPILRAVSRERLKRDSRWAERIEFLDRTVLNGDGCLYIKDGIIDKLSEMENNEPDKYYQVGAQIGQSLGFAGSSLDPIHVYTCQNTCSCAIGHKKKHHIPEFFPDVSNVDIRAILAQVNGAESA